MSGSAQYNQTLSEQRANEIKNILVKNGVPSEKILASGMGKNQPVIMGDSSEANIANRRVTFNVELQ